MDYRILTILESILGHGKQFSNGEYYFYCPFCSHHKAKLAVNLNKGKWQCWKCNAQGGKLLNLFRKLDVPADQRVVVRTILSDEIPYIETDEVAVALTLPQEFVSLAVPSPLGHYKTAMHYLEQRNITMSDILRYNIGYCVEGAYAKRIIIPSYDTEGTLNYFVGRDYTDRSSLAYLNPKVSKNVVAFDNQVCWAYPLVIVDGFFDAMAVKRNAIPQLGKTLSRKLQQKIIQQSTTDIYLALDKDALQFALKAAERLMNEGIRVYMVPMDGKDPAAIGFAEMQHRIKAARQLTFASLVELKLHYS